MAVKEFKDNYSKCHDKIVGKVVEELQHFWPFVSTNKTTGQDPVYGSRRTERSSQEHY